MACKMLYFWGFTPLFFGTIILKSILIAKSENNVSVSCEDVLPLCREEG